MLDQNIVAKLRSLDRNGLDFGKGVDEILKADKVYKKRKIAFAKNVNLEMVGNGAIFRASEIIEVLGSKRQFVLQLKESEVSEDTISFSVNLPPIEPIVTFIADKITNTSIIKQKKQKVCRIPRRK